MIHHQADVLIVGGGIVGCAAAYYLAQRGASVTLLEKNGVGSGASGRSGGGVRQSARASAEIPLANETVALFQTLSDELGVDIEYTQRGNLRLVETVDHLRPMQVDITRQQALGLDVCWVGQAEVVEMVPSIRRESVLGASFCPTDGHANPLKLTTGFANGARRAGAKFVTGCEVRHIRQLDSGEALIETNRGDFRARTVVVAAGAGTRALCLNMGFDLPLANMRYESLVTEALPPLFPFMFGVAAADLFFRQTRHGSVHFGGGLVQQSESEATTNENLALAAEHIVRLIPDLARANLVRTWGGLDPSTPDGIPIIDYLHENVIVAAGFCGHGFALGPVIGRYLAEWVASGERPEALAAFRRSRFDGWLQTKWTPSGSFEAVLATESTQVADGPKNGNGASPVVGATARVAPTAVAQPAEEATGPQILFIDPSKCTGCRMCEMACSIHNNLLARQTQLRIQVAYARDDAYSPVVCLHCEEAYCMDACPCDALVRDGPYSVIRVVDENCTACMLCVDACPYGGITYSEEKGVVIKCDLCGNGDPSTLPSVAGQGPACAAYCAPGAIRFKRVDGATWERMKKDAEANVKLLGQGMR